MSVTSTASEVSQFVPLIVLRHWLNKESLRASDPNLHFCRYGPHWFSLRLLLPRRAKQHSKAEVTR